MMKNYIVAICVAMSGNAIAGKLNLDSINNLKPVKNEMTNIVIVKAYPECSTATEMEIKKTVNSISFDYVGSNKIIHQCVYMTQEIKKECVLLDNCMSYAEWSKKNADFSVSLPRREFTKYFETHYLYQLPTMVNVHLMEDVVVSQVISKNAYQQ